MKVTFEVQWARGTVVYLKTDPEQYPRIVVGYEFLYAGSIVYVLAISERESKHYDCEISTVKNEPINHL